MEDRSVTLDARDPDRWVFFDFSRGAVVENPSPTGWDLAVRRYRMVVNGGEEMPGDGGAVAAGPAWDSVRLAPVTGYAGTRGSLAEDPEHPVLDDWYRYGFFTHLLEPRPTVYAIRTADGRYAKLQFRGYYCPGARPGCLTFRYAYQGDGSRQLARIRSSRDDVERPGSSPSSRTSPPDSSTTSPPTTSSGR